MNEVPTFQDREEMWRVLDFPAHSGAYAHTDRYLGALRSRYSNGSVLFQSFRMPANPVFDWYLERSLRDCNFFEKFWAASSPAATFPIETRDLNFFDWSLFEEQTPFHLGADLSSVLFCGGAYARSEGYGAEAKQLGEAAAAELLDEDYEGCRYYRCNQAWADFFFDVAWDYTAMVVSKPRRLIHVMLATDTD